MLLLLSLLACTEPTAPPENLETQLAVYGADDRSEPVDAVPRRVQRGLDGVAALVPLDDGRLSCDAGTWELVGPTLGSKLDLCPGEDFADQPSVAVCSSFLIGDDLLFTAGHCMEPGDCENRAAVFGYRMDRDAGGLQARTRLDDDDVYFCEEVLVRENIRGPNVDYAILRLDRPVVGHRRVDTDISRNLSGLDGAQVATAGFPSGLPMKWISGGSIEDHDGWTSFRADLDIFRGNSGGPVFDIGTGSAIGIVSTRPTNHAEFSPCYDTDNDPTTCPDPVPPVCRETVTCTDPRSSPCGPPAPFRLRLPEFTRTAAVVHRDPDGDGLTNLQEINDHHTDPSNPDSDGDGMWDGDEIAQGSDPLCAPSNPGCTTAPPTQVHPVCSPGPLELVLPGESIQDAVDDLPSTGGTVRLLAGTHQTGRVYIGTPAVQIIGEGPGLTIVEGHGNGFGVFDFDFGGIGGAIRSMTIDNSTATGVDSAVACYANSVTVSDTVMLGHPARSVLLYVAPGTTNIVLEDSVADGGLYGAFYDDGSSGVIRRSTLVGNVQGLIVDPNGAPLVTDTLIHHNTEGIRTLSGGVRILHSTLADNTVGLRVPSGANLHVDASLFYGNGASTNCDRPLHGIWFTGTYRDGPSGTNCIALAGGIFPTTANLDADYRLTSASVDLIDAVAADPAAPLDRDGVTRPLDGDGDGTALADVGAFEYIPPP